MALLKGQEIVPDQWSRVDELDDPLGIDHPIITLGSWRKHEEQLTHLNTPLGIVLESEESPILISNVLSRFSLVALNFPKLSDGRGFSYARLLRERFNFVREVRAVGEIRRDQYLFLLRCGFDAFEIDDSSDLSDWHEAAREVSVFYQPSSDRAPWVARRRHS